MTYDTYYNVGPVKIEGPGRISPAEYVNVLRCNCGALVLDTDSKTHTDWHNRLSIRMSRARG